MTAARARLPAWKEAWAWSPLLQCSACRVPVPREPRRLREGAPVARLRDAWGPARPYAARMALLPRPVLALLLLLLLTAAFRCQEEAQTTDWRDTLKTIRNGVHKIDTYLNAALDLLGGEDGLCQYKCSDGERDPGPVRPALPGLLGNRALGVGDARQTLTLCCGRGNI